MPLPFAVHKSHHKDLRQGVVQRLRDVAVPKGMSRDYVIDSVVAQILYLQTRGEHGQAVVFLKGNPKLKEKDDLLVVDVKVLGILDMMSPTMRAVWISMIVVLVAILVAALLLLLMYLAKRN